MTRKYLTKNQYGLSPQVAEEITSAIEKLHFIHPLLNHQVTFKAVTGCINGTVDEYDNEFTIKDTVHIYLDGEHFGELIINGTVLVTKPQYDTKSEDFIQVTFKAPCTTKPHKYIQNFININRNFVGTNGIEEKFYSLLTLHISDLEKAHTIITNKLLDILLEAQAQYEADTNKFIQEVKNKYSKYM